MSSIFEKLDNLEVKILGLDLNFWKASSESRFGVFIVVLIATTLWSWQGWDSGIREYGTSLHWSWFVIYGLLYIGLSQYYEEVHKITGSRSLAYCMSSVFLAVAIFEWWWSLSYWAFHGVPVLLNDWSLILKNGALTLVGILFLAHLYLETDWCLLGDRKTDIIWRSTLIVMGLWYLWDFPQTVYIQGDGSLTYIENNLVHLINVVMKALTTLSVGLPLRLTRLRCTAASNSRSEL